MNNLTFAHSAMLQASSSPGNVPPSSSPSELSTDICPTCHIRYLTKPKPSTGFHSPENEGRIFQQVHQLTRSFFLLISNIILDSAPKILITKKLDYAVASSGVTILLPLQPN